jgi:hypothetical protein
MIVFSRTNFKTKMVSKIVLQNYKNY